MSMCKYMFYKEGETYCPRLYCKADEEKQCIFSKKCLKVDKWIPIDDKVWKECYKYIMMESKNIPKDSYFVQTFRPRKNGGTYLYVIIGDKVEKISSDINELNQNYIYIKEGIDGYQVSLTPFVSEKKTYQKKQTKSNDKKYE